MTTKSKKDHTKAGAITCIAAAFHLAFATYMLASGYYLIGAGFVSVGAALFLCCIREIILEATSKDKE